MGKRTVKSKDIIRRRRKKTSQSRNRRDTTRKKGRYSQVRHSRGTDTVKITIIGHGNHIEPSSDNKLVAPYATTTSPGYYGLGVPASEYNLALAIRDLGIHHSGLSQRDSLKHLTSGDINLGGVEYRSKKKTPDSDVYGAKTTWRLTRYPMGIECGDGDIIHGEKPKDDLPGFTRINSPYGIYDTSKIGYQEKRLTSASSTLSTQREAAIRLQNSLANITDEVYRSISVPGGRMTYKGIKHWGSPLTLESIQEGLSLIYPGKTAQIYISLCRVYDGDHAKQDAPGKQGDHKQPHLTFKHTTAMKKLKSDLSDKQGELMTEQDTQKRTELGKEIREIESKLEEINKDIDERPMIANLEDDMTMLAMAHKKKKTRRKKKKKKKRRKKKKSP